VAIWSAARLALSLAFAALVYVWLKPDKGLEFITGYLISRWLWTTFSFSY